MEHTVSAASNVQLLQGDMTRGFASVLHHHVVKRAIPSLDQDSAMDLCKQLQSLTPRRIMELFGLPHFKYKEDALDLQELNGRITFGFGSLFFEGLLAHIEEQLRIKLIELFGWKLGKLSQALEPLHDGLCQYYTDNAIHMVGEMKDLHNGGFPLFTSVYQVTSYRNRQGRPILRGKPHKGARDSFPRFDVDRFIDKCMSKYKIEFSAVEHGAENVTHEDTGTGDFPHNHRYKFLASYGPSIHKEPHKRDRRDQRSRGRRRRH